MRVCQFRHFGTVLQVACPSGPRARQSSAFSLSNAASAVNLTAVPDAESFRIHLDQLAQHPRSRSITMDRAFTTQVTPSITASNLTKACPIRLYTILMLGGGRIGTKNFAPASAAIHLGGIVHKERASPDEQ